MEITCVTMDSTDPVAVATFWNEALQWGGVAAAGDGSGAMCGPPAGGMYLEFVRVSRGQGREEPGAPRLFGARDH